MIKLLSVESGLRPVIVCDICDKVIEDAGCAGIVMPHPIGIPDGERCDVLHVHKGQCHESAEARLGGKIETAWHELTIHLVMLLFGLGIDEEEFAAIAESKRRLDRLC